VKGFDDVGMKRCQGLSRSLIGLNLVPCEQVPLSDPDYCYIHRKIADGLITTIDAKTGPGHELSWKPLPSQQVSADLASKMAAIANHEERKQMLSDLSNLMAK
jgi:hypothetical protein